MASFYLSPIASIFQYFTDVGIPFSGGLLWTYAAGTSTPTSTWTDITGSVPNANPIQLSSNGRLPNVQVWQQGGVPIKVQVSTNAGTVGAPLFGVQLGPTFDQISGINDPAATLTSLINPASGFGADMIANAMRSYDLVATVRAANVPSLAAGQTLIIDLQGSSIINDGGGGFFYWNASSTAADDAAVSTIKPTAAGATGRYLRLNAFPGLSGSFTQTVVGGTTAPTVTFNYLITGGVGSGVVTVSTAGSGGFTSNSTSFGLNGWPSGLRPLTSGVSTPLIWAFDNNLVIPASISIPNAIAGNPVISIFNNTSNWTASGNKGFLSFSFSYVLK